MTRSGRRSAERCARAAFAAAVGSEVARLTRRPADDAASAFTELCDELFLEGLTVPQAAAQIILAAD